jgi:hypothetical protein
MLNQPMKKVLPQANSLEKVVRVLTFAYNKPDFTQEEIAVCLGFKDGKIRQSAYYLNACYYLGLVDAYGRCTDLGREVMNHPEKALESIYKLVFLEPYCSKIIATIIFNKDQDPIRFAEKLLIANDNSGYGCETYHRRAQSFVSWCNEVVGYINNSLLL